MSRGDSIALVDVVTSKATTVFVNSGPELIGTPKVRRLGCESRG